MSKTEIQWIKLLSKAELICELLNAKKIKKEKEDARIAKSAVNH